MATDRAQGKSARPAAPQAPEEPSFRKSTLREYFESIVIAVILALFIRTFVVQAFKIPTGSMENNLLIGDHLLVNKFVLGPSATSLERALLPMGSISRGNVIVFKFPEEPERDFIKRVIGLPGETLRNTLEFVREQDTRDQAERLLIHRPRLEEHAETFRSERTDGTATLTPSAYVTRAQG